MYMSWDSQLPMLVAGYLQWQFGEVFPAREEAESSYFEVTAVGITGHTEYCHIIQHPGEHTSIMLVRVGLLGCSPIDPLVAITLDCLELYHQIHCRQSSFSVQAMTKVLCALYNLTACYCQL
ncbi:hypothetical protein K439DRAFT_1611029 [Ramaria rubella]|nr:hypothetical protein K439DRAFT_1611029 [Ramaria rubella]